MNNFIIVDSSFSLQEMMLRLKQKIRKMNKTFFIFSSIPKVKYYYIMITLRIPRFGGGLQCVGILLGVVSDCEEIVGQLPSLSLIPQFSTTISAAKLVDNSFSTFSCNDSPIPNPDINFTILLNWVSISSL